MPDTRNPSCEDESSSCGSGYFKESSISGVQRAEEEREMGAGRTVDTMSWKNLENVVMSLFCLQSL